MGKHAEFGARQSRGVHDGRVDPLVDEDDIVLFEQRADGSQGGGVAGGETEGRLAAFEGGQGFIEFVVGSHGAADQPRGAGSCAKPLDGFHRGFLEGGFVGEAQVVVGTEVQEGPAADLNAGGLR